MGEPVDVVSATYTSRATATLAHLGQQGVIPVLRLGDADLTRNAIALLRRAGFTVFEITLTIPGAVEVIAELANEHGVLVGAGTVTTLEEARACIEAGAAFVVSPCLVDGLPEACRAADVACIMGALTPTEVQFARRKRADAIKIFPASSVGGPRHLRALRSVFPDVDLIPTGGVTADNVIDYLEAGAPCVGVGSDLFDLADLAAGRDAHVIAKAAGYLDLVRRHRGREARANHDSNGRSV
ncbi:MAG: bifunctional 4-hydroxy-2-oxoglutarate aldolase/2-dehydro-3-deoxy-phosphogluconate aldolase [Trueperaceae bacterium]